MHTRVYTSVIPEVAVFIAPGSRLENWNKQIYEDKPNQRPNQVYICMPISLSLNMLMCGESLVWHNMNM
jgi:hypothetical protein